MTERTIRCWCGAVGTESELFCYEDAAFHTCAGTGELDCHCGGDLCVCHNHGTFPCPGCADCNPAADAETSGAHDHPDCPGACFDDDRQPW